MTAGTSAGTAFEVDALRVAGRRRARPAATRGACCSSARPASARRRPSASSSARASASASARRPFWTTSGSRLVAGMSGFGMWQERVGRLVKEAAKASAVLHLGNLVELMEVGKGEQRPGHRVVPAAGHRPRRLAGRSPNARRSSCRSSSAKTRNCSTPSGRSRSRSRRAKRAGASSRSVADARRRGERRAGHRRGARRARPAAPPLRRLLGVPRPAAAVPQEPARAIAHATRHDASARVGRRT